MAGLSVSTSNVGGGEAVIAEVTKEGVIAEVSDIVVVVVVVVVEVKMSVCMMS
jgi:hypothetical protein